MKPQSSRRNFLASGLALPAAALGAPLGGSPEAQAAAQTPGPLCKLFVGKPPILAHNRDIVWKLFLSVAQTPQRGERNDHVVMLRGAGPSLWTARIDWLNWEDVCGVQPEIPFWSPAPRNCIAPEADCESQGTFCPKKPEFAEE